MKRLTDYADCAVARASSPRRARPTDARDCRTSTDPRVLVDFRTADDAGVYRWDGGPALVQTVDFFTPIVDDPYDFGQIAAANALSDVYAMGGVPRTALAIAALPKNGPPAETSFARSSAAAATSCAKAGVALLGGHTVTDPGNQVRLLGHRRDRSRPRADERRRRVGDALVLTKPLGTGIMVRARKYGQGD